MTDNELKSLKLFDGCICAAFEIHLPGNRRKVANEDVQIEAKPEMIRVTKKLFESEKFKAIEKRDREFYYYLRDQAGVSSAAFRKGTFLVPLAKLEEVEAMFETYKEQRETLVSDFLGDYELLKIEARDKLFDLYDEADYLPPDELRSRFWVDLHYLALGQAPGQLKTINKELYEKAQARINRQWEQTAQEIFSVMRSEFLRTVKQLRDRVTAFDQKEPGKKVQLQERVVNPLKDFVATFRDRNVTNDEELEALAAQVEELLGNGDGVTAESLREVDALRAKVKDELGTIVDGAKDLVEFAPKRKFVIR